MNVSIGDRWEGFVEGLRLVEEREAKLQALRDMVNASIAEGGAHSDEELDPALDETEAELAREGY